MKTRSRLLLLTLILALTSAPAFAQGGATSSITGLVADAGGGVIPGASVTATNDATASKATAITNGSGTFTIPALNVGTYTVTVALQGFKTAVLKAITLTAGSPANVKATLEIGGLSETVVVESASQLIQTQSSGSSNSFNVTQISSLPLASRNVLDFVQFLPGVQTPAGTRDSIVNGMPQSSINITIDGVSVQDNYLKTSDGFFARMSPRIDAVEQVTVTTAGQGAEATSQGSTQIKFSTRSGSNLFTGSAYHYYQSDSLDSNTYFNKVRNLPKGERTQNQPGFRVGGPIAIPGLFDGRNRAFFFVNYEESRTPSTLTTNTTVMRPAAVSGTFRYVAGQVDLYALAAANGQLATPDPKIVPLLQQLRGLTDNASGTYSEISGNLNSERFSFQQPVKGLTRFPTMRVDYNLPKQTVFTVSYNRNNLLSDPDTTNTRQSVYPNSGLGTPQISTRYTFSSSLKSVLGPNLVNEARYGRSGGPTQFSPTLTTAMFDGQGGFNLGLGGGIGASNLTPNSTAGSTQREGSTKLYEDTLTWLKGAHSLSFGGSLTQADVWLLTQTRVPTIAFGMATGDTANSMFTAATMPGSTAGERTNAASLYALLTGRVTTITANARLDANTGKYVYNGDSRAEGRLRDGEIFVQDNWKVRPNLSVNAGMRYVMQLPFYALNGSYSTATVADVWGRSGYKDGCVLSAATPETCNLFRSGELPGQTPTFQNLGKGVKAYNTDWDNIAPSIGLNWTPGFQKGILKPILGEQGDSSISAGWSRSFERHGMSDFTDVFGLNPGLSISATRSTANGNLGGVPLLFRSGNLGAPVSCSVATAAGCLPEAPSYPLSDIVTGDVSIFDPDIEIPYTDSYTVALQRSIGRTSAIEVRYVGARNRQQWTTYNYNEANILENGFLDEFKLAQANLQAHIASGCGGTGNACSFAYRGLGTGTSPLPIYLAFFTGTPAAQATDLARYALTSNWTSSNFVNALSRNNPNPFTPAGTNATTGLGNDPTRRANALAAGLPANFFLANPDLVGGANVTGNGGFSDYRSMQFQYRRRLSNGFQFDANYSVGRADESRFYSFRVPRVTQRNSGTDPGDVTHAIKANWVLELPFGAGKRWGSNAGPLLDRIVGGWQLNGTMRLQSGRLLDLGNVRVVGMSIEEAQKAFELRKVNDAIIYTWPQDIVDQTIKAYSFDPTSASGYGTLGAPSGRYFAPASGADCVEIVAGAYGQCGVRSLILTGPFFKTMDLNLRKMVTLTGRRTLEFRMDMLNVFDVVNFTPVTGVSNTTDASYQITAASSGRTIQLVSRFSW